MKARRRHGSGSHAGQAKTREFAADLESDHVLNTDNDEKIDELLTVDVDELYQRHAPRRHVLLEHRGAGLPAPAAMPRVSRHELVVAENRVAGEEVGPA